MIEYTYESMKKALDRLGHFGELFMNYKGDPRGPIGPRGWPGGELQPDRIKMLVQDILKMEPVKDVDENIWRPVHEDDLKELVALVSNTVEVVRCKDCKFYKDYGDGNKTCYYWTDVWDASTDPDGFCSNGEKL